MPIPILREETRRRIHHPETLRGLVAAGDVRVRIDHDINRWFQDGFGAWPGDPRLCLYANVYTYPERPKGSWELWRLEADGRYHLHSDYDGRVYMVGPDFFWQVIERFHKGDIRAGHDPIAEQEKRAEQIARSQARDFRDYTEDILDHYVWPAFNRAGRTLLRDGKSPAR